MSSEKIKSLHSRRSPRAEFHDYSGGDYFVTICTRDKNHYFGKIENGIMKFSEIGQYANDQLMMLPKHYKYAMVPMFVVMPNHIHAIICINPQIDEIPSARVNASCIPTERTLLSVVIGGFKRAVTMYARRNNIEFGWHSRYHDHIIRSTRDGNNIADYIDNNVSSWDADCFNFPKP